MSAYRRGAAGAVALSALTMGWSGWLCAVEARGAAGNADQVLAEGWMHRSAVSGSEAARAAGLHVVIGRTTGTAILVRAADYGPIALKNDPAAGGRQGGLRLRAAAFLSEHGGAFGIREPQTDLALARITDDALGWTNTRFDQLFKGVEVFTGRVNVHQDPQGNVMGASGRFYPIPAKLSVVPTVTADGATQAAIAAMALLQPPNVVDSRLVVVDTAWYGDAPSGPRLSWYVVLADEPAGVHEAVLVDAHNGEVLDSWSLNACALNRAIYDGLGTNSVPGTLARSEGQGVYAGTNDVNLAYDYAGDTYRYLLRAFGRDSIDGSGMQIVCLVNSTALNCPNASWNGSRATFCAGAVTDDIVAHELMHGVTGNTAGLIYQNQSGQLNESFSDVFGEMVDLYNGNASLAGPPGGTPWPSPPSTPGLDTPNNPRTVCSPRPTYPDGVRWLCGEDATAFGGAIRDLFDPTCRNHPDRANSPLMTCPSSDSGGVHQGSGVPNHAFMLATDGGTFNGRTVSAIGPIKVGAVWYRTLATYLTPASDFSDAYVLFLQAADDLIGTAPNDPRTGAPSASTFTFSDREQIRLALEAVEMNTSGLCGQTGDVVLSGTQPTCGNGVEVYSDSFESAGNNGWTLSRTAMPTPYDWVKDSTLPFGRGGTAWFCADADVGDCSSIDESGVHSLISPVIPLAGGPSGSSAMIAFTHYLASEGRFDGGNVSYRINGATWKIVPRSRMLANPYNSRYQFASQGNTNPQAGQPAWSGGSGQWGTTIIDLSGEAVPGDSLQVRFDFGKDGCGGVDGWYVDDFRVIMCPDCDGNAVMDANQALVRRSSEVIETIGGSSPRSYGLTNVPPAEAGTQVVLEFTSIGDWSTSTEYANVLLGTTNVGRIFELGDSDCASTANRSNLLVPADVFNSARTAGGGSVQVNINPTIDGANAGNDVNATICGGTFITVRVQYRAAGVDADQDLVLDACVPACPVDINGSGVVDADDIFAFLNAWFALDPMIADWDGVGGMTADDIFAYLNDWFAALGPC